MSISHDLERPDTEFESSVPVFVSAYILESCRKGRLFNLDTYRIENVNYWMRSFLGGGIRGIRIPSQFEESAVQRIFVEKTIGEFEESDLRKMFESVDVNKSDTIKNLIEQNREKSKLRLKKLENFLKQDEFPPSLWMEFARFARVYTETSEFLEKLVFRLSKFKPNRMSQVHERNRLGQTMISSYSNLIEDFFKTMLAFMRLGIFLEVWSCKDEADLFTDKCIWTFRNIRNESFEPMFIEFHDSIGQLRQSFFRFNPQEAKIDFSRPTDWAFKQLIQMT